VRPDQLRVTADASGAPATAEVRAIERLGDRMDVVLAVGATRLVARIENDARLREGAPAGVALDLAAAHLFAPGEDGARLADVQDRR
jgi:ABC-type sugar transport system ATPase subunit